MHLLKHDSEISVIPDKIVTFCKLLHLLNALFPMDLTEEGIVKFDKLEQLSKDKAYLQP